MKLKNASKPTFVHTRDKTDTEGCLLINIVFCLVPITGERNFYISFLGYGTLVKNHPSLKIKYHPSGAIGSHLCSFGYFSSLSMVRCSIDASVLVYVP